MTVAKPIGPVLHELKNLLEKSDTHTIKDYEVMDYLGFSPQSWPRWGPKLREICDDEIFTEGEYKQGWFYQTENYKINYDKKLKVWKIEQLPLMKKKTGEEQLIPMTDEDYQKITLFHEC